MRTMILLSMSVLIAACNGAVREPAGAGPAVGSQKEAKAPAAAADQGAVHYKEIRRGAFAARRPVGLCELGQVLRGGAGVYEVVSLKGVTEETPEGGRDGFTYVELALVEAWSEDAPERPVARITGGPAGKGVTRGSMISLAVGEKLGVLLFPQGKDNKGYYGLDSLGLFQEAEHGGFTNGQLFLEAPRKLSEIGRLVAENAAAGEGKCPHDLRPVQPAPAPAAQPKDSAPVPVKLGEGRPQ